MNSNIFVLIWSTLNSGWCNLMIKSASIHFHKFLLESYWFRVIFLLHLPQMVLQFAWPLSPRSRSNPSLILWLAHNSPPKNTFAGVFPGRHPVELHGTEPVRWRHVDPVTRSVVQSEAGCWAQWSEIFAALSVGQWERIHDVEVQRKWRNHNWIGSKNVGTGFQGASHATSQHEAKLPKVRRNFWY